MMCTHRIVITDNLHERLRTQRGLSLPDTIEKIQGLEGDRDGRIDRGLPQIPACCKVHYRVSAISRPHNRGFALEGEDVVCSESVGYVLLLICRSVLSGLRVRVSGCVHGFSGGFRPLPSTVCTGEKIEYGVPALHVPYATSLPSTKRSVRATVPTKSTV